MAQSLVAQSSTVLCFASALALLDCIVFRFSFGISIGETRIGSGFTFFEMSLGFTVNDG
jgi:hypothetical protein